MAKYKVAPTKSNLFKIRQLLSFTQEGHTLLEQKREILIAELLGIMARTESSQKTVEGQLKEAYKSLEQAVIRMGGRSIAQASLAVNIKSSISVSQRRVMGVKIPLIETDYRDSPPYYSLEGTSFWLDEAVERFKSVLKLIGRLAQDRIALMRLAREVSKTVHRINALEKIYLPDYEETLKYIEEVLEEQERETFYVSKLLKKRLKKRFLEKSEISAKRE